MNDKHPMTCDEALRLLAAYLDGELHDGSHESVEHHLEMCRSCFSRAEFERRLRGEMRRLRREEVSSDFADRVRGMLESFAPPVGKSTDGP